MGLMGLVGWFIGLDGEDRDVLQLDRREVLREDALGAQLLEIILGEECRAAVDFDAEHLAAEAVGEGLCVAPSAAIIEHRDMVPDLVEKSFKHRLNWV